MKPPVWFAAVLLSASALAQQVNQPREPTEDEFLWLTMLTIARNTEVLKDSGLEDATVQRLMAYAKDSIARVEAHADKFANDVCAQKGKTSEQLARYFESREGEEEALQDELVHNLGLVLSDEEERVFKEWAHNASSVTMLDTPLPSEVIREQRVMPDELVESYCQRGARN